MTKIILKKKKLSLLFVGGFCTLLTGCSSYNTQQSSAELGKKVAHMELEPVTRLSFVPIDESEQRAENIRIVYTQGADTIDQIMPAAGHSPYDNESKSSKN